MNCTTAPKIQEFTHLRGSDNQTSYSVKVNLANPLASTAKIYQNTKKYRVNPTDVKWGNIKNLSPETFRRLVKRHKNHFTVTFDKGRWGDFWVSINLNPSIASCTDSLLRLKNKLELEIPDINAKIDPSFKEMSVKLKNALEDETIKIALMIDTAKEGASLFPKLFAWHQLKKLDLPLTFHVSLKALKDPQKKLMEEVLDLLDLSKHMDLLRNIPITLVCEGFHELYPNGRGAVLDNLYQSNHLGHYWRSLKLVISCKDGFLKLPEDHIYFWPESYHLRKFQI